MTDHRRILLGVIGAAHGIKGELRVKTYTADPLALGRYGPLAPESGSARFTVANLRHLRDDMVVVRFAEVRDRSHAESLTQTKLFIDRAAMPAPDEDEFYNADLIGLQAVSDLGRQIGRVVNVANFGAGDLLEIAPPQGETLLVPFRKAFVPLVDLAGGRVVINEGALIDDAEDDSAPDQEAEDDQS